MMGWAEILFLTAIAVIFFKRRQLFALPGMVRGLREQFKEGLSPDRNSVRDVEEIKS